MKKSRFSEAQIIAILQQQQNGQTVAHIVREHSISEATFYTWKTKYAGLQVSEWMHDYNTQRPHQALGFLTPMEFKQAA